jgi:Polyketide cyclase / dehydrase and lipid transport
MADQTTATIVVANFDRYPQWARGVKSATVLSTHDDGRADQVAFVLDAAPIKDEYTLAYTWDGDARVTWRLVRARMLRSMEGAYILRSRAGSTEVTYELEVDLTIPMIGLLKRKGERVVIDAALKGLKQQVESAR